MAYIGTNASREQLNELYALMALLVREGNGKYIRKNHVEIVKLSDYTLRVVDSNTHKSLNIGPTYKDYDADFNNMVYYVDRLDYKHEDDLDWWFDILADMLCIIRNEKWQTIEKRLKELLR